jgi:IMP dehydrogenase/GMP reductase
VRQAYTYSDVCIEPVYNNVLSRAEPTLATKLCLGVETALPFLPANMDTVIGDKLAKIIFERGGIPIFHRFTDFDTKVGWINDFEGCFISSGIKDTDIKEAIRLIELGLEGVCIDIAHGHDERMKTAIPALKQAGAKVIAGNVCSVRGYSDLVEWGADAVKVGIGPGAACTTRKTTGFGVPQFTAVYEIGKEAMKLHVPFIADGGISGPDDIAKALAAGASTVMMGKQFAILDESAAEKSHIDGVGYVARYRGQASEEFQNEFFGGMRPGTVAEGEAMYAEVWGGAEDYLDYLSGSLRSALTYGGARDVYELQRKCRGNFWRVSSGANLENGVREG